MKNNRRGGLGRGLGALIPMGPATQPTQTPAGTAVGLAEPMPSTGAGSQELLIPEARNASQGGFTALPSPAEPELAMVPGARFAEIPVESIVANPKQPRQVFDNNALEELKASIEEVGFLQPIVVRVLGDEQYELVMGERRWRAAQALERTSIPAIIRDTRDDAMLRDALLENIHRANLNPLEEAAAYQQLLEEFGATHEELARRIGRSRSLISNTIRLLNLPPKVQNRVAVGELSAGHARALLGLPTAAQQQALAERIVAEGLSVRTTEELVHLGEVNAGEDGKSAPAQRRPRADTPGLTELADRLADRFDTRVKVNLGTRKGKITIEFATIEDLERIVDLIGVGGPEEG